MSDHREYYTFSLEESKSLETYSDNLDEVHELMVATKMGGITGEEKLREKISNVYGALMRYSGKPTQSQIDRLIVLEKELADIETEASALLGSQLEVINEIISKTNSSEINLMTKEEFQNI